MSKEIVEIRRKVIRGFEVPYFAVETRKKAEAVIYICLGCDSVYGDFFLLPMLCPLTKTIWMHQSHAGKHNPDCLKSLFLKVDWDLIEAEGSAREQAAATSTPALIAGCSDNLPPGTGERQLALSLQ